MQTSQTHAGHLHDGVFASTPLDRLVIPQAVLDIRQKTRSNPLEWKGQFSPQFVEALLQHYRETTTKVLDPFAGSGTVLLEAARAGLAGVGLDVNPAAANLASVYCLTRLDSRQRQRLVNKLLELTADVGRFGPLFEAESTAPSAVLLSAWNRSQNGDHVEGLPEALAAFVTLADFYKRPLKPEKVLKLRTRLIQLIEGLPSHPPGGIEVRLGDARSTGLPSGCVDLVVTSPPYINVYNYHQKYRASVEAMGWQVLRAARSEIGSNRKHRQNRILTVIQYSLDMAQVLTEVRRLLAPGGMAVFVVGRESMVRKTPFFNGEIIAEVAVSACGFGLALKQERVFTNRYGQAIYEDILHLAPTESEPSPQERDAVVRQISKAVLTDALDRCPAESKPDVLTALEAVAKVNPSPILQPAELNPTQETQ